MNITLQHVTAENWRVVVALQVEAAQQTWVASNAESLIQAAYGFGGELAHLRLFPLAVYASETPVGFAMYNAAPTLDRFFIMRLMIDQIQQGKGYGRAALKQILALLRAHPQAKEAAISYEIGNEAACRLYQSCGFEEVGPDGDGGIMMWQALNPQTEPWESLWKPGG